MKTRAYKNGNVTIKCEGECAPYELPKFAQWLCNRLPFEAEVETGDAYSMSLIINTDGRKRYYSVREDDMNTFRNWMTVRLVSEGYAPMFRLPDFYADSDVVWDGDEGVMFTLCKPAPEAVRETMEKAGCKFVVSHPAYAPEIRHESVFVPYGVCFSYC